MKQVDLLTTKNLKQQKQRYSDLVKKMKNDPKKELKMVNKNRKTS